MPILKWSHAPRALSIDPPAAATERSASASTVLKHAMLEGLCEGAGLVGLNQWDIFANRYILL